MSSCHNLSLDPFHIGLQLTLYSQCIPPTCARNILPVCLFTENIPSLGSLRSEMATLYKITVYHIVPPIPHISYLANINFYIHIIYIHLLNHISLCQSVNCAPHSIESSRNNVNNL